MINVLRRPSICVGSQKKRESVIISVCDLFDKATIVTNSEKELIELDNLLEVEKQIVNKIKMLQCTLEILIS